VTECAVAFSDLASHEAAGTSLGAQLRDGLDGESPDVVITFLSSRYDYSEVLQGIQRSAAPKLIVGCSSAGEFASGQRSEGSASALAIRSDRMRFSAALASGVSIDRQKAAERIAESFRGVDDDRYPYRSALILADALAGYTDNLIEALVQETGAAYQFFGGGAGDDGKFSRTHVFLGAEAATDAVVGLQILSEKPIGLGMAHGWQPGSDLFRVTEASGNRVRSLNSIPCLEIFERYARDTGQKLDVSNPLPFFLHNILGIQTKSGFKLRVPLAVEADGTLVLASDVPTGATVAIMKSTIASSVEAARSATELALAQLQGHPPKAALFFDCVATRLQLGKEFGAELDSVQQRLGKAIKYAGCNSYGQIVRQEGQFSGFHNCTAVVCVIPE
jgi:hypothetical protein